MRGLVVAALWVVTGVAAAQPAPTAPAAPQAPTADPTEAGASAEAAAAFQRGRDLAKAGRFDEACVEFGRSYELDPALGTAANLADCLERQGQVYRAWVLFDLVARSSQNVQSRARLARQRADALAAQLATVVVRLRQPAAPGLAIRIGEREEIPVAEIRDLVEPGDIDVVATVPGRPAFRSRVHAVAGAAVTVEVPALAAQADAPTQTRRRRSFVLLAAGAGAAGAAALTTSVVLGLGARSAYRSALAGPCLPGRTVDDTGYAACQARVARAGERADRATVFAVAGGVLGAAALALVFVAPRETVQLAPVVAAGELGLGVAGRF
jgi:tetratricopeptide (TPR) repeat protein